MKAKIKDWEKTKDLSCHFSQTKDKDEANLCQTFFPFPFVLIRYESPVLVQAVTNCEGWVLRQSSYQKLLKFFPLSARWQLYKNYADIYSSLLCRYHETIDVMKLKPKDAKLARLYDVSKCSTMFPMHEYGLAGTALQVRDGLGRARKNTFLRIHGQYHHLQKRLQQQK